MHNLHIRSGQIIGRDHAVRQANCQDGLALNVTNDYTIAIICDGCSEGPHSEVGAKLGAHYLAEEAGRLLGAGFCTDDLPQMLHDRMVTYLSKLSDLSSPTDRVQFVQSHLLFTIVGCVVTAHSGIIFQAGDGIIAVDAAVECIDQHNQPHYIAYHIIREALPEDYALPEGFTSQMLPAGWQRIAIASDGFEPELLPQAWQLPHPRGLQRRLIYWSNQEQRFRDDATIVTIERQQPKEQPHDAGGD